MRHIRYSLNPNTPPTATDADHEVRKGDIGDLPKGARLLPPCSPSKIICVGRNYAEHAKELGNEVPKEPLIFLKPPSSLIASGDSIVYPRLSHTVDYEGELGIIIGKRGKSIPHDQAHEYVLGYTCVNDVTARDLQQKDGQWTRAKGFDTFCAVGPCMVPPGQVQFQKLRVQTYVDGSLKQDASVEDMIFSINHLIAFISAVMTLEAGDLIATGTPPGVGPLHPGSRVDVNIDGVGTLENSVIQE